MGILPALLAPAAGAAATGAAAAAAPVLAAKTAAAAATAAPTVASGIASLLPTAAIKAAATAVPTGIASALPKLASLPKLLSGIASVFAPAAGPAAAPVLAKTATAAPSAVTPLASGLNPFSAFKTALTQGLGSLVPAPPGANLAGNLAATDSMVKAGAQGAMQAGANSSQAARIGQGLQRLGKGLSGKGLSGMGQGGAAEVQPANHEVSRGNRQPQNGSPMNTLPQQGVDESPGMQLFNSAPPMGGMMPMNSMPMNPVQPAMLSGGMYAQPKIDVPQMMPPMRMIRDGGYISGPGTGRSDSIPARIYQDGRPVQEARLSDGEFVMTERAVRGAGNGDRAQGAARMYRMMREFEKGGRVHGRA